jgi:C4-dicarboxylate-specific signal transduction histidine kinase
MYPVNKDRIAQIERLACVGETTTEIMHELNNQLTALLGYVTMLRSDKKGGAWNSDCLEGLIRTCENCCDIARGILDFARGVKAVRQKKDLRRVVLKPLEVKTRALESAGIEVRTQFPNENLEALVNELQLQQVVFNILHNAHYELLKVERRVLDVCGRRQEKSAVITFSDSGRGIHEDHVEKIFDPFFSTKPSGEGTGLGLSISRRIVEDHGGSLRAERGSRGGATFILDLPLAEEAPNRIRSGTVWGSV